MSPVTHFILGWLVAESAPWLERRDRALVALAGVAPDLDGLGAFVDLARGQTAVEGNLFYRYHHTLGHNVLVAALVMALVVVLGRRRWWAAGLAGISFHLHLLCDVIGSRGHDGSHWPIPYLEPFSDVWQWSWAYQWEINAWQNLVITSLALALAFFLAWRRGYSALEMVSESWDRSFVGALRGRFGEPRSAI